MLLKFNSDAFYNGELVFEAGKTYEIENEDFARRWLRRGMAEVILASLDQTKVAIEPSVEETQDIPVTLPSPKRRGRPRLNG